MDSQNVQTKKTSNKLWWIVGIVITLLICLLSCALIWGVAAMFSGDSADNYFSTTSSSIETEVVAGNEFASESILEIPISGPILNVRTNDLLSFATEVTYGYEVKEILTKAAKDQSIKGILLEIDSPGGTITGSKAISDGVAYYKSITGKPVYAHIIGMGASGAYWSAASADYIFADSGTLIGSIGVIFGPFKHYNTVLSEASGTDSVSTKDGIETFYITSGGYKDVGSPDRKMTNEEKAALQKGTDDAYTDFVSFVSKARNITEAKIKSDIKALPYGEQQALELKLIDKVAAKEDAISALAEKANVKDYKLIKVVSNVDFWGMLLGSTSLFNSGINADTEIAKSLNGKMLYLYNHSRYIQN